MTATQKANWDLVVSCLHYDGVNYKATRRYEQEQARLLCNGYGNVAGELKAARADGDARAIRLCQDNLWDWSHVRDSDHKTIAKVARYLCLNVPGLDVEDEKAAAAKAEVACFDAFLRNCG